MNLNNNPCLYGSFVSHQEQILQSDVIKVTNEMVR